MIECKHEWEITGRSPVLDDVWKNCKKCKMRKEDYNKEFPTQFGVKYTDFISGHVYQDSSQIQWKVIRSALGNRYQFKRPGTISWVIADWASYGGWIKAMRFDEVTDEG